MQLAQLPYNMDAEDDDDIYASGGLDGDGRATRQHEINASAQQNGNEQKPADLEEGEEEDEDEEESDSVLGLHRQSIGHWLIDSLGCGHHS